MFSAKITNLNVKLNGLMIKKIKVKVEKPEYQK